MPRNGELTQPAGREEHSRWPTAAESLTHLQTRLAQLEPESWTSHPGLAVGGCFVCFGRGGSGRGAPGDPAWAAAVVMVGRRLVTSVVIEGRAGAPYAPGLLAAREGSILHAAVGALSSPPDVLLVNATGLDHPRRAGMALHLGWAAHLPTIGVTHRPLLASAPEPPSARGSATPMSIDGEQVGWLIRTRSHAHTIAVSPGWRTDLRTAREVVLDDAWRVRTPEPVRRARQLARIARSQATGSG